MMLRDPGGTIRPTDSHTYDMNSYLDMRHPVASGTSPLSFLRRYMVALALAAVLAAVEVDRPGIVSEPAPIVMSMGSPPPRRGRMRPYRAHYRRRARR